MAKFEILYFKFPFCSLLLILKFGIHESLISWKEPAVLGQQKPQHIELRDSYELKVLHITKKNKSNF